MKYEILNHVLPKNSTPNHFHQSFWSTVFVYLRACQYASFSVSVISLKQNPIWNSNICSTLNFFLPVWWPGGQPASRFKKKQGLVWGLVGQAEMIIVLGPFLDFFFKDLLVFVSVRRRRKAVSRRFQIMPHTFAQPQRRPPAWSCWWEASILLP